MALLTVKEHIPCGALHLMATLLGTLVAYKRFTFATGILNLEALVVLLCLLNNAWSLDTA